MDIMDLLARARPGSLDPPAGAGRRASDLARAIAVPRAGMTARPGAGRRPGLRRAWLPARVIATGISAAALAGTAGAVAALNVTGTPAARPRPAADTPGGLRNAILTAVNGVGGDVFYTRITEIYSGRLSRWNSVSESWLYPLQPQAGQEAYRRDTYPGPPGQKSDDELTWTEPSAGRQSLPAKTRVIDVLYGNRTWSVTTAQVQQQAETGGLQALRTSVASGDLKVVRKTEADGQAVLELTARSKAASGGDAETWWVSPVTYLPVRTLETNSAETIQVDYGFLPPTPANLAKLKITIPPGFTQTPTIQKP